MIKYNVPEDWKEIRGLSKPYKDFEGDKPIYVPGILIGWTLPNGGGFMSPDKLPPEMVVVVEDKKPEAVEFQKPEAVKIGARVMTKEQLEINKLRDKVADQEEDLQRFREMTFELGRKLGEYSNQISRMEQELKKAAGNGSYSFARMASVAHTCEVILDLFPCEQCGPSTTALRDLLVDGMEFLSPGLYAKTMERGKESFAKKKQELMDRYGMQR